MILVVDLNCKENSLGYCEFVLPIITISERMGQLRVKHFSELKSNDISECDCIILSATPLKDNFGLSQPAKFEWIKPLEKPLLGISTGMQIICLAFNIPLVNCLGLGMTKIITLKPNPLFSGKFEAYALHQLAAVPSNDFVILAESKQCVQAMKHKQRDTYCVIFNPEARNKEIIERFDDKFDAHRRV